jgi:uncharacterized protein (TIGR00369 family)
VGETPRVSSLVRGRGEGEMRDARWCFVCGPQNPLGLRLTFRAEGEEVQAVFVPGPHHVGYDGVVHGGILAAVLDDAMANLYFLRGEEALTTRMEVRFRREGRPGEPLSITAREVGRRGQFAKARAVATNTRGEVVAEAEGTFLCRSGER